MLRKITVIRSTERPRGGTVGGTSGQTATSSGIQLSQSSAIHRASVIVSRAASPYPAMMKKRIAPSVRRLRNAAVSRANLPCCVLIQNPVKYFVSQLNYQRTVIVAPRPKLTVRCNHGFHAARSQLRSVSASRLDERYPVGIATGGPTT